METPMEIRDVHAAGQPVPLVPADQGKAKATGQPGRPDGDRVEISAQARRAAEADELVARVRALPEVRPAVVDAARRALQRGELDTPAAIEAAATAITRQT
jgi:hypothetical protein